MGLVPHHKWAGCPGVPVRVQQQPGHGGDWLRKGHVTQAKPMRASPGIFAEALFLWKLLQRENNSLELLVVTFATM